MHLSRRHLRSLVREALSSSQDKDPTVGFPGELGVGTGTGQSDSSQSSGEETDIDSEIESTTDDMDALRDKGTDPSVAPKRNVLQRKLAMLKQKKAATADVIGEVRITRGEIRNILIESLHMLTEGYGPVDGDIPEDVLQIIYDGLDDMRKKYRAGGPAVSKLVEYV